MKTSLILILYFLFMMPPEVTAETRWKELYEVVNREIALIDKSKMTPKLEFRKLELLSERLKLVHEQDNRIFLHAIDKTETKHPKSEYFKNTKIHYESVRSYGNSLLKGNHPYSPYIILILGFNSRDYGQDNGARGYFSKAVILLEKIRSPKLTQAQAALAELHFNSGDFEAARGLYEKVAFDENDSWSTKHLFNLAWCYFKLKNFDRAVKLMERAHELSKNQRYVKVADQVDQHIGAFHIVAGTPLKAMDFYLRDPQTAAPLLISLATKCYEKGHPKEAELIFKKAEDLLGKKREPAVQESLIHAYLDFYRQYLRFFDHYKTAVKAQKFYGSTSEKEYSRKAEALEKISSAVGFLQVKLLKDMKENVASFDENLLRLIQGYFQTLIRMNPKERAKSYYLLGESFYSVKRLSPAAGFYRKSIIAAAKEKDLKLLSKALNSLLALAAEGQLPNDENRVHLIFAYRYQIRYWPKDEMSRLIYPKLFSIYEEARDDKKAAGVVLGYASAFPADGSIQRELMTRIIDLFIESKDTRKLSYWVHRLKGGLLNFEKIPLTKMESALSNLLFITYQNLATSGQQLKAAQGFETIYQDKNYSPTVKARAAKLAAISYLEAGRTKESVIWLSRADELMLPDDRNDLRDEKVKMAELMYQLQDFDSAYKVSSEGLYSHCQKKDRFQKRFFEISVLTSLVEDRPAQAEEILDRASICLPDAKASLIAVDQIFEHYVKRGDFKEIHKFFSKHPSKSYQGRIQSLLRSKYWSSEEHLRDDILAIAGLFKDEATQEWLQKLSLFQKADAERIRLRDVVIWNEPVFDPEKFNTTLEAHLLEHQKFKKDYQPILESNDIQLTLSSINLFSQTFESLGRKVTSLRPLGMDSSSLEQFQSAMKDLARQFTQAAELYRKQLKKSRPEGYLGEPGRSIASEMVIENPISSSRGLTIDLVREFK